MFSFVSGFQRSGMPFSTRLTWFRSVVPPHMDQSLPPAEAAAGVAAAWDFGCAVSWGGAGGGGWVAEEGCGPDGCGCAFGASCFGASAFPGPGEAAGTAAPPGVPGEVGGALWGELSQPARAKRQRAR